MPQLTNYKSQSCGDGSNKQMSIINEKSVENSFDKTQAGFSKNEDDILNADNLVENKCKYVWYKRYNIDDNNNKCNNK